MHNPVSFIYGTAWKKEETEALVLQAIDAGFTAFDTANQKKHYREDFICLLYTSPSPRDRQKSRMPSSA